MHAPATAGTYLFDWDMLYELHWRFGQTTGVSVTVGGTNSSVTYFHIDGLGSPVAWTDGAGNVISRTRYEPYGYVASGVQPTIGFTGHVNDVDTGLTYMQQRYYDPVAGRFLSIDPVITDANTGGSFNRYVYANNSPYRYIDEDGREARDFCFGQSRMNCFTLGTFPTSSDKETTSSRMIVEAVVGGGLALGCDILSYGICAGANPAIVVGTEADIYMGNIPY